MTRIVLGLVSVLPLLGSVACGAEPVPPIVAHAQACAQRLAHDPPADDGSGVGFLCSTPIFSVEDLTASLQHYQHRLGFSVDWVWGEPASFDDVDRLYEEYQRRGATILEPPRNHPWGMREMLVEDRDGHRLRMGQSIGADE